MLIIEIDFNSDEAIYIQLCNQIIMGIATDQLKVGEDTSFSPAAGRHYRD